MISIGPSTTQRLKKPEIASVFPIIYELTKPSPDNLLAKLEELN